MHLAIVLCKHGLLQLAHPDTPSSEYQLLQQAQGAIDKSKVTIDFCSLVYQYALSYLSTKTPELALKYLALIPESHKEVLSAVSNSHLISTTGQD